MTSPALPDQPAVEPLVSISILTYNHRPYIAQALDSVLNQDCSFPFEIIVGDDASNDGTQEILRAYQARYPQLIRLFLHESQAEGIAGRFNNLNNLYHCRGKYIAMLDGDDFWISPQKLAEQVSFLERHKEYALCFHDARLVDAQGVQSSAKRSDAPFPFVRDRLDYNHQDVAAGWFMPTSSLVYRHIFTKAVDQWFHEVYSADYAIQLMVSSQGKVRYFPHLFSARRIHERSFSFTIGRSLEGNDLMLAELAIFARHFKAVSESSTFSERYARQYHHRASIYQQMGKPLRALWCKLIILYYDRRYGMQMLRSFLGRKLPRKAMLNSTTSR